MSNEVAEMEAELEADCYHGSEYPVIESLLPVPVGEFDGWPDIPVTLDDPIGLSPYVGRARIWFDFQTSEA